MRMLRCYYYGPMKTAEEFNQMNIALGGSSGDVRDVKEVCAMRIHIVPFPIGDPDRVDYVGVFVEVNE